MDEQSGELLSAVREIRDLIRLMAEPAIAERDKKLRDELRRIVGKSVLKAKAVLLMDGSRLQSAIQRDTGMNQGNLSTLVKQLNDGNLLSGNVKEPKLVISIPANFFENGATSE
jgi:DNA-binding MarR family transcriptional regulator